MNELNQGFWEILEINAVVTYGSIVCLNMTEVLRDSSDR